MRPTFHTASITRTEDVAPGVRAFHLTVPDDFSWAPGAHAHVGLPGFNEGGKPHRELVHNMSIFTLEREGEVAFVTHLDRSGSAYKRALAGLGTGDALTLFREGSMLALRRDDRPVVLLSQGIGISPLRPLIMAASADMTGIPQLTSINVTDAAAPLFAADLAPLAADALTLTHVRHRGEFREAVSALPAPAATVYVIVGSEGFLASTIALLRTLDVADEDIVVDRNEAHRAPLFKQPA